MKFWIKEINWKKTLLCGFIYTVVATIIHQVEVAFTLPYYMDPNYFGVWSKLMMPTGGPPPAEFMITSLVFSFVIGVSLTLIYYYLRGHLPANKKQRIFYFADLMVATSFIFFSLPVYLLLNVPLGLLVVWFVSGFIILVIASAVIVKVID